MTHTGCTFERFISGPILQCISYMFYLILSMLILFKDIFGNPSVISNAYYEKLIKFINCSRIVDNENNCVCNNSDFIQQCCVAQGLSLSLRILDQEKMNHIIIRKLRDKLVYRWT